MWEARYLYDMIVMMTSTLGPIGYRANSNKWAEEVRAQWNDGQPGRPINAYVNYANGFEPVEQWYGHEAWRLERLRGLKAKYDPYNRFRYYNPIVQGNAASAN